MKALKAQLLRLGNAHAIFVFTGYSLADIMKEGQGVAANKSSGGSPDCLELPNDKENPRLPHKLARAAISHVYYLLENPRIYDEESDPEAYTARYRASEIYNQSRKWLDAHAEQLEVQIAEDLTTLYDPSRESTERWNRGSDRARIMQIHQLHQSQEVSRLRMDDLMNSHTEASVSITEVDVCVSALSKLIVRQQYLKDIATLVDSYDNGSNNSQEVQAVQKILGKNPFKNKFNQNILALVMRAGRLPKQQHADEPPASNHQLPSPSHPPEQPVTTGVQLAA